MLEGHAGTHKGPYLRSYPNGKPRVVGGGGEELLGKENNVAKFRKSWFLKIKALNRHLIKLWIAF